MLRIFKQNRSYAILIVSISLLFVHSSEAAENQTTQSKAESAALNWVYAFSTTDDLKSFFQYYASPELKSRVSAQWFHENITVWRIQTGGKATSTEVTGSSPMTQRPDGVTGSF